MNISIFDARNSCFLGLKILILIAVGLNPTERQIQLNGNEVNVGEERVVPPSGGNVEGFELRA